MDYDELCVYPDKGNSYMMRYSQVLRSHASKQCQKKLKLRIFILLLAVSLQMPLDLGRRLARMLDRKNYGM